MKNYSFAILLISILLNSYQFIKAEGVPQIVLSPSNGQVFEGGLNGYGKTIGISYDISNLESCWHNGKWIGFEVWLYIDNIQVTYYRDPERPAFFTYHSLSYTNSLDEYLGQGVHTIKVRAKSFEIKYGLYLDVDSSSTINIIQIISPPKITVDNNFTAENGITHGQVMVGSIGIKTAPFMFEINSGQTVNVTAISPQTSCEGYTMVWHTGVTNQSRWMRNNLFISYEQSYPIIVSQNDNLAKYFAELRRVCNLTFNSAGGVYINGSTWSSPKVVEVVEQNTVTASGQWYYSNGIEYSFSHWTSGGQTY
ncbi:MAG: hypothetical protein HZA74_08570, partial [Ignavibacteriales bacterium]|nr:hypothetical protein [Ignavibacteriales bacterium]